MPISTNPGSPPRMRGKAGEVALRIATPRITPAHAGKSFTPVSDIRRYLDHPRACGEKPICPMLTPGSLGSPPRMRGKARASCSAYASRGITPAHAGKSQKKPGGQIIVKDHPRACGEK